MFEKIKKALFPSRYSKKSSAGARLKQAQLSNDLVYDLNKAIYNDEKVYFRIDIDGRVHAFVVAGKNSLVELLRDFMDEVANEQVRQASWADIADNFGD
jgi:hypothetical protein